MSYIFRFHASFVFSDLGINCSHLIDFIGSYSYPCLPQGLRRSSRPPRYSPKPPVRWHQPHNCQKPGNCGPPAGISRSASRLGAALRTLDSGGFYKRAGRKRSTSAPAQGEVFSLDIPFNTTRPPIGYSAIVWRGTAAYGSACTTSSAWNAATCGTFTPPALVPGMISKRG